LLKLSSNLLNHFRWNLQDSSRSFCKECRYISHTIGIPF